MKIKVNTPKKSINWAAVVGSGVVLGYMASMLYLMLVLTATLTA